jgi:hypothetical protein
VKRFFQRGQRAVVHSRFHAGEGMVRVVAFPSGK